MHSIWNGSLTFGLVNIPIQLYSGSSKHAGIELTMLHKKDHAPIQYERICTKDGKPVPYEDIVKGYEYKKGDFVEVAEKDLEKVDLKKTKTIEIKKFVEESEVDLRMFEKPYYLEPDKGAEHAYALLRDTLSESKKAGIVSYVIRSRQNIGIVKPLGRALILIQMRYMSDIKNPDGLKFPGDAKLSNEEVKMARAIVDQSTEHFIPEDWHDTYAAEIEKVIKAKTKGTSIKPSEAAPQPTEIKDLMQTLKASLK